MDWINLVIIPAVKSVILVVVLLTGLRTSPGLNAS